MAFPEYIIVILNVACAIMFALAVIMLVYGFMWRKSDPTTFKMGIACTAMTAGITLLVKFTIGFYAFSDALLVRFRNATENNTSVDYSGIIHPAVFAVSAYWWILAVIVVVVCLALAFFGRKQSA